MADFPQGKITKNRAKEGSQTSSPAKVFQSRASKPSGVAAQAQADALNAGETYNEAAAQSAADLANANKAKIDELLAALKK